MCRVVWLSTVILGFTTRKAILSLCVAGAVTGCAPVDAKSGLGPNEPVATVVVLTTDKPSIAVGEVATLTAHASTPANQSVSAVVDWSSDGGSLVALTDSTAHFSASAAGTYKVRGTGRNAPYPVDSTSIVVTPLASPIVSINVAPGSVNLSTGAIQAFTVSATRQDGSVVVPSVSWSATGGSITAGGLFTAGSSAGTFRVIATQQGGSLADTSAVTITAGSGGGGTVLFTEGFEDANITGRGWFDATTIATTTDARPGSAGTHALQWHWTSGSTAPQAAARMDFAPSNSVYLSYWVKQSANWTGSGQSDHPHMFHFLTTADDHWSGLSRTHLTLYDELTYQVGRGGSIATLAIQDALMIDNANLLVDLTNVTENRAVGGYNGRPEPGVLWDAFVSGGLAFNYKILRPSTLIMTDATKSAWHHVESYWQLNTISGGKGQPDGVVQYWFDGVQLVDRHDIYFRTGANPTMQFRTFVMAPYIGNGSPVDQYMWIDDLTVGTARP